MNGYEGCANSIETQAAGTGEHKSAKSPAEVERGRQSPAGEDLTPTPSRPTTPHRGSKPSVKDTFSSAKTSITTNGVGSRSENADHSEVIGRLHAHSPAEVDRERGPSGISTVYGSYPPLTPGNLFPVRSLTPKYRPEALFTPDAVRGKGMSDSTSHPIPTSGPSRPASSRRQQQPKQLQQQSQHQQRGLQPYGYYTSPSPSEPGFPRNSPISSQGVHQPFAHSQQPTAVQPSAGFVGPYTMSPPPSSLYPQHQVQHQYAYPQLSMPGMPPLTHAHSHTPPEFYPASHSSSPTRPPLYAPSFHASIPQEHAPSPTVPFDYDRTGNSGRTPSAGSSPAYAPQQPFASFSFHPTITAAPQFTHSPFSPAFPAQQGRHVQQQYPPPSYGYMTGANPSPVEDTSQSQQQPSGTWWYIPPHSASPSTGPYPSIYFVDAYGNPSNTGPGPGLSSLPSPSSSRPIHPSTFSIPDLSASPGSRSGSNARGGGPQRALDTPSKTESGSSSQIHPSPSPLALGESVSERGHQQDAQQGQSKQSIRRSFLPNPPAQRSEWVMWVGNVPSDATHDELWRFFARSASPTIPLAAEPRSPFRQKQQQQPQPHLPAGLLSPTGSSSASETSTADASGVQSVFLIARSNCAFVNYASEAHLSAAVQRFNGIPLRHGDPRCPRLVCRVRGKEEDLKAGVGGQRGTGIHTRWVREQREKAREQQDKQGGGKEGVLTDMETNASEPPGTPLSLAATESGTESSTQSSGIRHPQHSSSSGSTTSGFLARYFPKRYFILKSLTQYDLDLSVEKGVWATQPHNETVLNQAFRNSSDVYLIFSVNKSGEFYGYARMAGPIGKATVDRVLWASRTDSQHSHSPAASFAPSVAGKGSQVNEAIPEENENSSPGSKGSNTSEGKERETASERPVMLFSPSEHRLTEGSPQPVTPATQKKLSAAQERDIGKIATSEEAVSAPLPNQRTKDPLPQISGYLSVAKSSTPTSAPAIMGPQYLPLTSSRIGDLASETLDPRMLRHHPPDVELNPEAPYRAVRSHESRALSAGEPSAEDTDRVKRRDTLNTVTSDSAGGSKLREILQPELPDSSGAGLNMQRDHPTQWGLPFKVQWIQTRRLPFSRARHLRNPWNHEREVKVSRDGTELEPSVGQALLEEWDKDDPQPPAPILAPGGAVAARRGPQYRRTQSSQSTPMVDGDAGPGPSSPRPHQQKQRPRQQGLLE